MGGQRTLRPYWRNYFEQTDAIVWVVDSADRMRMQDCKEELRGLLSEDVRTYFSSRWRIDLTDRTIQRLAGASLLVFANKQDLPGALSFSEIISASLFSYIPFLVLIAVLLIYRPWTSRVYSHTTGRYSLAAR